MKGFVENKPTERKQHHDQRSKLQCLFPWLLVIVRNYRGDAKWIPGAVLKKLGPVTCSVDIGDGRAVKLHIHQLRQNVHYSP